MEKINIPKTPRSSQVVVLEEKDIRVDIDYNQKGDRWLLTIENIGDKTKITGLEAKMGRCMLFHHRNTLGISGDFFFLPTGEIDNTIYKDKITYNDIINDNIGLYYIHPDEVNNAK